MSKYLSESWCTCSVSGKTGLCPALVGEAVRGKEEGEESMLGEVEEPSWSADRLGSYSKQIQYNRYTAAQDIRNQLAKF
jgi:hypothetical protein